MPPSADPSPADARGIALDSTAGRWTVAASVLGSGAVFLEGSVVNVALPALGRDLDLGLAGLQWVLNGYLLTLAALLLFGGVLGDVLPRRRVFAAALAAFAAASVACALMPSLPLLVAARLVQGAAGAILVPNSLAMLETTFAPADRGTAIGRWAGWSAVSTAIGPLAGGWLVDAVSWRAVFAACVPFALAAAWIAWRRAPDPPRRAHDVGAAEGPLDWAGALLVTAGLGGLAGALVAGPEAGWDDARVVGALVGGVALLVLFAVVETRARRPLLPFAVFRSRQFAGANLVTLVVYAALGGLSFLFVLQLQASLGYSPTAAGAALLPVNALLLLLSPLAGRVSRRIGPRWPLTVGALVAGAGMVLLARVQPGAPYVGVVLPAVTVFGFGLAAIVAPVTAAALGALDERQAGLASGVNNAAARVAGLLAVAGLPLAAGLGGLRDLDAPAFGAGYARAMYICAALCAAGALVAVATVRGGGARRADAPA